MELNDAIRSQIIEDINKNIKLFEDKVSEVEKILFDKYDLVYNFFCNILEREEQYKVLRARRCQVLFNIFLPIILYYEKDMKIRGSFISDNSVIKYKDAIFNTSALIIDDILIHGRGMASLYEMLDKEYSHNNIKMYILYKSKDADIPDVPFWNRVEAEKEVFDWEWRDLSCRLVDVIYSTTAPYVSFIGSYTGIHNENIIDDAFIQYTITNGGQRQRGESAVILFEKADAPAIFTSLGYDCCVRIYRNALTDEKIYVPYVFIKNLSKINAKKVFEQVCRNIPQKIIPAIYGELSAEAKVDKEFEYQIRLFTALISQIYGIYIMHQYKDIFSDMKYNEIQMCISYDEAIAKELGNLRYEDIVSVLYNESYADSIGINIPEDDELEKTLEDAFDCNSLDLQKYFYLSRGIDERSIRIDKPKHRKKGLTTGCFYDKAGAKLRHDVSCAQIKSWDSGIAACHVLSKNGYVAFYNVAGEQSFRYVLDAYTDIIRELISVYNSPMIRNMNSSSSELVLKRFEEIKRNRIDIQKKDMDTLETFIRENVNRLGAWAISQT